MSELEILNAAADQAPFSALAQAIVDNAAARPVAPVQAADDKEEKKDEKKDAKADDQDGDGEAGDKDEKDDKKGGKKKSKKAKSEDGDGDEDKKDDKKDDKNALHASLSLPEEGSDASDRSDERDEVLAAARGRERARIAAIVNSDAAKRNPHLASNLALNTVMSRKQAIAFLDGMPAPVAKQEQPRGQAADTLRSRMATVPEPNVGGVDASAAPTIAQQIVLAGKKRRGEV